MIKTEKTQIFLLHFAGGNSYSFQFLKPFMEQIFELCPLELPGRGKRIGEPLIVDENQAIEDYVAQLTAKRNKSPFIIFGHSMGASLGLKVTEKLEKLGDPPCWLIVSGNAGPGMSDNKIRSKMNDVDLKFELKSLGGVPEEVFENMDLYNFFIPIMKADFQLLEEAPEISHGFRIQTPICAIMGDQETQVDNIENWGNYTAGDFRYQILNGNHFFIHNHPARITKIFKNCYDRSLVYKH